MINNSDAKVDTSVRAVMSNSENSPLYKSSELCDKREYLTFKYLQIIFFYNFFQKKFKSVMFFLFFFFVFFVCFFSPTPKTAGKESR